MRDPNRIKLLKILTSTYILYSQRKRHVISYHTEPNCCQNVTFKSCLFTLDSFIVGLIPNITNFELLWTWHVELWTHSNSGSSTKAKHQTFSNPQNSPNIEPAWPEPGRTQAQIRNNWTLNLSEPRFIYQNRTMNPHKPSKNPEL